MSFETQLTCRFAIEEVCLDCKGIFSASVLFAVCEEVYSYLIGEELKAGLLFSHFISYNGVGV